MARVVVANFMSIDGVIQAPLSADEDRDGGFKNGGWVVPYSDTTVAEFMRDATVSASGMLLGRRSYTILADAWSAADESEPAVAAMNGMPKYVVSRSLRTLDWNNSHLVDGDDIGTAVRELKADGSPGYYLVLGSGTLVAELGKHDLIDEYRLLVFPLLLGKGKRMFSDEALLAHFDLARSVNAPSGVAVLTYRRSR